MFIFKRIHSREANKFFLTLLMWYQKTYMLVAILRVPTEHFNTIL